MILCLSWAQSHVLLFGEVKWKKDREGRGDGGEGETEGEGEMERGRGDGEGEGETERGRGRQRGGETETGREAGSRSTPREWVHRTLNTVHAPFFIHQCSGTVRLDTVLSPPRPKGDALPWSVSYRAARVLPDSGPRGL